MSSSFGALFRFMTFGESHGPAVGVVVDGMPPAIRVDPADVQRDLDRRRPGQSPLSSARREPDRVEILSGLFEGVTLGTPIAMLVRNADARPEDYEALRDVFRPGHADFVWQQKYGVRDHRGGGRASGRETLGRVAAGALARIALGTIGVTVAGGTVQVGDVVAARRDWDETERNPVRCPDAAAAPGMAAAIEAARAGRDSVGGVVEVVARGVPVGWGDPVMDRLDARLGAALLSIPAVRGVEIGDGFALAGRRGSESNDVLEQGRYLSNHAGGIAGGISNGAEIVVRAAVRAPSTIGLEQTAATAAGGTAPLAVTGRHDPCICPRVVPVAEAMVAVTLMDAWLRQRALRGRER